MKKNTKIPNILQLTKAHQDEIRELVSPQMKTAALYRIGLKFSAIRHSHASGNQGNN